MNNYEQRLLIFLIKNKGTVKFTALDIARIWKRSIDDVQKAATALRKRNRIVINPRTGVLSVL